MAAKSSCLISGGLIMLDSNHKLSKFGFITLFLSLMLGCSEEPVKLGFIGGMTGRVADLGTGGRNGVTLAIEEQNARGGINGQPISIVYKDDKQDPVLASSLVKELIESDVNAIIGPMTSAIATVSVEHINKAQKVMMACTVTTDRLTGLDDYFIRNVADLSSHASHMGSFISQKYPAAIRAAAVMDLSNEAYTRAWLEWFQHSYEKNGGKLISTATFNSTKDTAFSDIVLSIMAEKPQVILLSVNAVDAALLIKQIKQVDPNTIIVASNWAGTDRLIQLSGQYAEGTYAPKYVDINSSAPQFLKFKKNYLKRFKASPTFPSIYCYDATRMLLSALMKDRNIERLKTNLLNLGEFQGVQGSLKIDKHGDGQSKVFISQIKNGQFELVD
ncbi:MAG: ABC transporter substrate-binding protein [Oceanospirillaceae bacterium]|nr:ABC transporter substrate-binding protein [Oceanospirillaceae bacterium]|tara:strand:- start:6822 stop:7985 length:1164 start_codon:yes stop_codon:yes gene_type:complete